MANSKKKLQIKAYGTVPAQRGPVVLATDAAVEPQRIGGGFLATSGHYGVRAHPYSSEISGPSRVVVAELRAVLWGLQQVTQVVTGPVMVLIDSTDAIRYLTLWAGGATDLPDGYDTWRPSGNASSLERLQALVQGRPGLAFKHEKGHAGHALNEAADSLAKLGLRASCGKVAKAEVARLAEFYAAQRLRDYGATRRDARV
jgi:ribonuclease HI